jgi:phosphatidylglycerol lysyltransferase
VFSQFVERFHFEHAQVRDVNASRQESRHLHSSARLALLAERWRTMISPLAGAVCFAVALWLLHDLLARHAYHEVVAALDALPAQNVALALLLTAAAYAVLPAYDWLAFCVVRRPLPLRRIALGSFVGHAFANSFGHTLLTGAAVRFWIYAPLGIPASELTLIVLYCSLGFWLGYLFLGGLVFTLEPLALPAKLHLPLATLRPLGVAFLVLLAVYAMLVLRRAGVRLRGRRFSLPSPRLTAGQLGVAVLDLTLMATVLWVLLPSHPALDYPHFLAMFLLALMVGIASQVPAGLGVLEGTLLLLLPPEIPTPAAIAALIAFRGIYYALPLLLALLLVALREGLARKAALRNLSERLGQLAAAAVPQVVAIAVFLAGTLLLLSGALPAAVGRLAWLSRVLPHPLIEASHFLASVVGVMLLLLARGLQRRIDAAYVLTVGLLGAGIVLSLAKGFDYEEALILAILLVALAPCHVRFYRQSSLFAEPLTWRWSASIAIVLGGSLWLYAFAFKHVEYTDELWWDFALHAEASRALRATIGASALGVLLATARLFRPAPPILQLAGPADQERAAPLVAQSPQTYANLAFRGDKALLFSRKGNAFLMYGRHGRTWIAMGDPIGPREEAAELAWQFRELCDRHDGWPVFFEVGMENVDLYLDLGLTLTKLGEEARVDLSHFDLAGAARAHLRQAHARVQRLGCRFEIIVREAVPSVLPQLAQVSEAWLANKTTREKGFSNASFDVAYLQRFPVAVVRRRDEIIAFANVWPGARKEELSIDLMRYTDDAPNGTMDYLLSELMLWGKKDGYRWFNFGMAPLSGLHARAGAPLWYWFGRLIYQYGEHFYNFRGLRRYKEKFGPVWTPRYLASPGGLPLPAILLDVAACISGGFAGILAR